MWWTRNSTWWWMWLWCGRFSNTHVTTLDLDLRARPSARDLDQMYWHIWVSFCRMVEKVKLSLIFWKLRCDLTVWFLSDPGPIIVYTLAKEENRNMVTIHLAPSSCSSPQFASIKTCYVKFIWRYSWPNLFFPGEKWQTKAIKSVLHISKLTRKRQVFFNMQGHKQKHNRRGTLCKRAERAK